MNNEQLMQITTLTNPVQNHPHLHSSMLKFNSDMTYNQIWYLNGNPMLILWLNQYLQAYTKTAIVFLLIVTKLGVGMKS